MYGNQLACDQHQLLHGEIVLSEARGLQRLNARLPAVPILVRRRECVDGGQVEPESLADVPDRRSRPVRDDGSGQCGTVAAVLGIEPLDYFFTPLVLKVNVDVRHLAEGGTLPAYESFEKHAQGRGA